MAVRYLTKEEKEMITVALNLRRNYMETGSISMGAADLQNINPKDAERQFGAKIQALSEDQMKLILATSELERKIFTNKIYVEE